MSGHTHIHTHIHTYTHTYTHTHTHTYTHDNYYNPRCAHAHRGLITRWAQACHNLTRLWQPGYNLVTGLSTCYNVVTTLSRPCNRIVNLSQVVTTLSRPCNNISACYIPTDHLASMQFSFWQKLICTTFVINLGLHQYTMPSLLQDPPLYQFLYIQHTIFLLQQLLYFVGACSTSLTLDKK